MASEAVRKLADKIFAKMNVSCDRGGCAHHSGHEFCSVDSAWDEAMNQAEEAFEKQPPVKRKSNMTDEQAMDYSRQKGDTNG